MEYRELGPEENGLTARDLYFLSLQKLEDGTYAQRAFDVGSGSGSGPTIAFTLSSGSVNGDYVFSHIGTNVQLPTGLNYFWIQPGGDVDTDFIAVEESGSCLVWQGGVEMYLSFSAGSDPLWPPDFTDWVLGEGGIEPTPTFS